MVAEAALVAVAVVRAEGAEAEPGLVFRQEEVGVEHPEAPRAEADRGLGREEALADDHLVQPAPLALIFVAARHVAAGDALVKIPQAARREEEARAFVVGLVVEIAHDQERRVRPPRRDGVDGRPEGAGRVGSVALALFFAAVAGGEMGDEDVERIARRDEPGDVQEIARRLVPPAREADGDRLVVEGLEAMGLVEEGHVGASRVTRLPYYIKVALPPERGAADEIGHDGVALHFAQADERRRLPLPGGGDGFRDVLELLPVAPPCPAARAVGRKLVVVRRGVVFGGKEIFHVVEEHPEGALPVGLARGGQEVKA